jgi:hypothetical protein
MQHVTGCSMQPGWQQRLIIYQALTCIGHSQGLQLNQLADAQREGSAQVVPVDTTAASTVVEGEVRKHQKHMTCPLARTAGMRASYATNGACRKVALACNDNMVSGLCSVWTHSARTRPDKKQRDRHPLVTSCTVAHISFTHVILHHSSGKLPFMVPLLVEKMLQHT